MADAVFLRGHRRTPGNAQIEATIAACVIIVVTAVIVVIVVTVVTIVVVIVMVVRVIGDSEVR